MSSPWGRCDVLANLVWCRAGGGIDEDRCTMSTAIIHAVDAVKCGDGDSLTKLVESRAVSVSAVIPTRGCTLLHIAAEENRCHLSTYLLQHGADPDDRDIEAGETPFMWAVRCGHAHCAKALLQFGADINAKNIAGDNALFIACESQNVSMVRLVLEWGAEVDARDAEGNTALQRFLRIPCFSVDIIRLLLQHGADRTLENSVGDTAYHIVASLRPSEIAFPLVVAIYTIDNPFLFKRNRRLRTPTEIAYMNRNGYLWRYMVDIYLTQLLPSYAFIIFSALAVLFFFFLIEKLGIIFGFVMFVVLQFVLLDKIQLVTLPHETQAQGLVYGVLLTLFAMHYAYVSPLYPSVLFVVLCVLLIALCVCVSLWRPQRVTRQSMSISDAILQSIPAEGRLDVSDYEQVQVCASCSTYKSDEVVHCEICDVCYDIKTCHHCSYLHTCIGATNRRFFVAMLLLAVITFYYFMRVSFKVQYELCSDFHTMYSVQKCMLGVHPSLAIFTWLSVALMCVSLMYFIQELGFVSMETKLTDASRGYNVFPHTITCDRRWQNIKKFILTGEYTISRRDPSEVPKCCSSHHCHDIEANDGPSEATRLISSQNMDR